MIDHTGGLGSNIISCNNNFGLPTTSEVVLAERLAVIFPFVQKFRFLKTGTAACEAAIRVARAWHQTVYRDSKKQGIGTGYHGSGNITISAEQPGAGTYNEGYIKYESVSECTKKISESKRGDISYCIVEPVSLEVSKEVAKELYDLRQECTDKDVTLIFDEVITGFRVPRYSISNYFQIAPDVIVLGKALGNGHPIAAVGMLDRYAETDGWFISNTHNGELTSIANALETLDYLTDERIDELWQRGSQFIKAFNSIAPEKIKLRGYATRAVWDGDKTYISLFCQESYKRGILLHPGAWWISHSHTYDIITMELKLFREIIEKIETHNIQLEGLMPSPVFKRVN
jgi:glutamate-1-semialdehyde 2,1-aminomutase